MMKKRDYRPKIHFSPEKGWMNDPNGMVYVDGEYHFFYQKYPYDTSWGPMHWGHATSRDLIHWEHQPIALYPDELGFIFSGSAVYDTQNSSEYGTNENPPIIAIYTSHHKDGLEQQSIAYSNDKGRHFEKSYLNPVIKNPGISDFRDPKAFWNPVRRCWSLVLAAQDRVFFYASQNMKNWEKTGEFGPEGNHAKGVWECPDLFPIEYKGKNVYGSVKRITTLTDAEGKEVAMVDCRWIVASLAEGRILREPGWTVENFWNDTVEDELPLQLHKCKDGLTSAGEWTAHYSQCDLNGHLNNAFYLDLVCDALPLEVMRKGPVTFASINYHREIPMGETAEVFYAPSADGWYVVGKHNGQTSFECYLEVGKTNV